MSIQALVQPQFPGCRGCGGTALFRWLIVFAVGCAPFFSRLSGLQATKDNSSYQVIASTLEAGLLVVSLRLTLPRLS